MLQILKIHYKKYWQQDVKDVGKGLLVASVKDKDGNILGFRQNPQ